MLRLGLAVVLVAAMVACERSQPSTSPEPAPAASSEPSSEPDPEPDPEPEPAPAAEPEEPEVSEIKQSVFKKDGFEARDLQCALSVPTRGAEGYIAAGLADADAELDACAPKGAAIEVRWGYVSGQAGNVSVDAATSKQANCVAAAMKKVRAGVEANCSAILLIGDPTAAAAAYDAR
jgi:outer membrane biosynthesis protein TonB